MQTYLRCLHLWPWTVQYQQFCAWLEEPDFHEAPADAPSSQAAQMISEKCLIQGSLWLSTDSLLICFRRSVPFSTQTINLQSSLSLLLMSTSINSYYLYHPIIVTVIFCSQLDETSDTQNTLVWMIKWKSLYQSVNSSFMNKRLRLRLRSKKDLKNHNTSADKQQPQWHHTQPWLKALAPRQSLRKLRHLKTRFIKPKLSFQAENAPFLSEFILPLVQLTNYCKWNVGLTFFFQRGIHHLTC